MPYQSDPEGNEIEALHGVADINGARLLEVGSGDGRLLFRYAASASLVVGCDPNATSLVSAAENCPAEIRGKVEFVQSHAELLPLADRRFDIALLAWSL